MKALVTGAAGFIGSHLAERLLSEGWRVIGVDCFTDYYDAGIKRRNLASMMGNSDFGLLETDIVNDDLSGSLDGMDVVFHQAAQAGVRASWGRDFAVYTRNNVLATQKLLEACKESGLKKFVFASSSSVYGDAESLPTSEDATPMPMSPYGVTKLAAEHLALLYHKNFGVPALSLRYFTVFGPRQRPDMAFHKLLKSAAVGGQFRLYGDGRQTRDFTYVSDIVDGNLQAAVYGREGAVYNLGGGNRLDMLSVIDLARRVTGRDIDVAAVEFAKGDVRHTCADTTRAADEIGFKPRISLEEGLAHEWNWIRGIYRD